MTPDETKIGAERGAGRKHAVAEFLATVGRLNVVEEEVEQKGVDPAEVAEIDDALNYVLADLDSTDDDDEALTLIQQRKFLRERLPELHDADTA